MSRDLVLDWAGRLGGACFFSFLLVRDSGHVIELLAARGSLTSAVFFSTLASRLAAVIYLALVVTLFLVRRPPVARSPSLQSRVTALAGAFLLLALLLLPRPTLSPAENVGAASLVLAGSLLSLAALAPLGRSFSILPQARRLVTAGPYAVVRHPIYLAQEIAMLGITWYYRSPAALGLFLVHLGVQLLRIEHEERLLGAVFPEYASYQARTARLIPGVY